MARDAIAVSWKAIGVAPSAIGVTGNAIGVARSAIGVQENAIPGSGAESWHGIGPIMRVMRRVDRAIFAIFLLAMVADVARSYAATPAGSELSGSLILSAASQLQGSAPVGAVAAQSRSNASAAGKKIERAPVFAAWSKALFPSSMPWSQVALLPPAAILTPPSACLTEAALYLPSSSLALLEHAGNPAP